jgi:hypothetical protein
MLSAAPCARPPETAAYLLPPSYDSLCLPLALRSLSLFTTSHSKEEEEDLLLREAENSSKSSFSKPPTGLTYSVKHTKSVSHAPTEDLTEIALSLQSTEGFLLFP